MSASELQKKSQFLILSARVESGAVFYNVSYKNSAAIAGDDFPQENQTQQVCTDFRLDTGFRIVFIYCCEMHRSPEWAVLAFSFLFSGRSRDPLAVGRCKYLFYLPLKNSIFWVFFFSRQSDKSAGLILETQIILMCQKWYFKF